MRAYGSAPLVAGMSLLLASSIGAEDLARESAVFAAAARQQIDEHLDDAARARGTVVCVGINPGRWVSLGQIILDAPP